MELCMNLKLDRFRFLLKPVHYFNRISLITGYIFWSLILIFTTAVIIIYNTIPPIEKFSFDDLKKTATESVLKKRKDIKSKHNWVPVDKINRGLLWAVVISEDSTFFEHKGINFDALYNAFADNLKKKKVVYGASTISQQVAKNLFLTSERNFIRKIKEYFITKSLEKRFRKNQILEIYLNIAEFGPEIYGVKKASKYYFNKNPYDINAAEGSFMALFLPSPRKYHHSIFNNKYLSRKHRRKIRRVLRDMSYMELISPIQYRKYIKYKYFR